MMDNSRTTLILIMLIVSFAAQFPLPTPAAARSPPIVQPFSGPSLHLTYWLNGSAFQNWNNSRSSPGPLTTATDGDNVTIMLLSTDGFTHSWFLDLNNHTAFDPTESNTRSPDFSSQTIWKNFTFTVRLGLLIPHGGNFTYRCVYHLASMYGTFKFYAGPVASFTHTPATPLVG